MPVELAKDTADHNGEDLANDDQSTVVQDIEVTDGVSNCNNQSHLSIIQQHAMTIEDSRSPPSKHECTKLVLSLSREVAVYCCLSMGIGGMGDCISLRDELRCLGSKVFDLIMLCKRRLMPLLLSKRVKEEERVELERLYRIFFGCLEMLQTEFIRAIALQSLFPLWDASTLLIQTGITEWMVTKKSCAKGMSGEQPALTEQEQKNLDLEEFLNLERKVNTLQELSYSTSQIMDIKPWDHTPDPDLTKISSTGPQNSSSFNISNTKVHPGDMETSDGAELELPPTDGGRRPKHRKCIILTLVIGSLVIVAGVLGLALALPNDGSNSSAPNN